MDSKIVRLKSPAKINVGLRIGGKRADGYHEIRSLMVKISLYDLVTIEERREWGDVEIECSDPHVPKGEKNIAYKAFEAFERSFGRVGGVRIEIEKKIPVAAGLGGGSSNAAQVLLGLRTLCRQDLTLRDLNKVALKVGADVPFFLIPERAAWAMGIGEKLEVYRGVLPSFFVLVSPGFPVESSWAYSEWDRRNQNKKVYSSGLTDGYSGNIINPDLAQIDWQSLLRNDLEPGVVDRHQGLKEIRQVLTECGSLGVGMSGSGPVHFGVFFNRLDAERVAEEIKMRNKWQVWVGEPFESS